MLLSHSFEYTPLDVSLVGFSYGKKSSTDINDNVDADIHFNEFTSESNLKLHSDLPHSLTRRQKIVMNFVALGMTNSEIAEKLCLSESTIKAHVSRVIKKLGVKNRWVAAKICILK